MCRQNVISAGVAGAISVSLTEEQLKTRDYNCTLPLADIPLYSVIEWTVNIDDYNLTCDDQMYNYVTIKGFTDELKMCFSAIEPSFEYRNANTTITISVSLENITDLNFSLSYRGRLHYITNFFFDFCCNRKFSTTRS